MQHTSCKTNDSVKSEGVSLQKKDAFLIFLGKTKRLGLLVQCLTSIDDIHVATQISKVSLGLQMQIW